LAQLRKLDERHTLIFLISRLSMSSFYHRGSSGPALPTCFGMADGVTAHADKRMTLGRRVIDHQRLCFLLADMAAAVTSAAPR
jgi:hypothetical protein